MKKIVLIFGLILLISLSSAFAADSAPSDAAAPDVVSASGYVTLELKEPPKLAVIAMEMRSAISGFSVKNISNISMSILSLLTVLVIFNIYQSIKYLQEQKSII